MQRFRVCELGTAFTVGAICAGDKVEYAFSTCSSPHCSNRPLLSLRAVSRVQLHLVMASSDSESSPPRKRRKIPFVDFDALNRGLRERALAAGYTQKVRAPPLSRSVSAALSKEEMTVVQVSLSFHNRFAKSDRFCRRRQSASSLKSIRSCRKACSICKAKTATNCICPRQLIQTYSTSRRITEVRAYHSIAHPRSTGRKKAAYRTSN